MSLERVTGPTLEPLSLAEAKAHLRVEIDDDDDLIMRLIRSARETAEAQQGRALLPQTWDLRLDAWPCGREIRLPLSPAIAVESVTYVDADGVAQTLDDAAYTLLDGTPGRLWLLPSHSWPRLQRGRPGAVTVRFTAGYADADAVPSSTKHAMLLLIANGYEHREATVIGRGEAHLLPLGVEWLLAADTPGGYP